jgi:hypothetical protein
MNNLSSVCTVWLRGFPQGTCADENKEAALIQVCPVRPIPTRSSKGSLSEA